MAKEVLVKANRIKTRKKFYQKAKWILLFLLIFLIILYFILEVTYNGGRFTISLDKNTTLKQNLVLYEDIRYKEPQVKLSAGKIDFLDNISVDWIPSNIDNEKDGSHNGNNYIAYTYYVENVGEDVVDYWTELYIDDVIKNVDEALRVMVYENGEKTIYAKINNITGLPEENTIPFYSKDKAFVRQRRLFNPNEVDKYTIVIWLEGDDPDCLDDILGGEIKLHIKIRDEHFVD
ncbi:MAG: hypothetical protein PUC23_03140 [bacterium]|nr:hypothetical protein [bacterium]